MLQLIASSNSCAEDLQALVPSGIGTRSATSVAEVLSDVPLAAGVAMCAESGESWRTFTALLAIRDVEPWVPVFVVAPAEPLRPRRAVDAMALRRCGADAVLTRASLTSLPADLVRRMLRLAPRRRLVSAVRAHPGLVRVVQEAVCAALLAPRPPINVRELAALVGLHRATFWRHWRRSTTPLPPPGVLIDHLVLLHAADLRQQGHAWRDAAVASGVVPSTLTRLAQRLFPGGLSGLDTMPRLALCDRILALTTGASPDALQPIGSASGPPSSTPSSTPTSTPTSTRSFAAPPVQGASSASSASPASSVPAAPAASPSFSRVAGPPVARFGGATLAAWPSREPGDMEGAR